MHKLDKKWLHARSVRLAFVVIGSTLVILLGFLLTHFFSERSESDTKLANTVNQSVDRAEMQLHTHVMLSSLNKPWDVVFAGDRILVSENDGQISIADEGKRTPLLSIPNVDPTGEGGLMGLAVDPDFVQNKYIYACYNTTDDIRVSRWYFDDVSLGTSQQKDIVTGIQTNSRAYPGRHSGCRLDFGPDAYLWIGTGDVAMGSAPQDPKSLAGKILRVDRDGKAAEGNLSAPFDNRIFSYGHRNTQGLAFAKNAESLGFMGVSAEHGPNVNDEVNVLASGNFGWNPVPGYNESVAMTDKTAYPDAIDALWASGSSTLAPSGISFVYGEQWGEYDGTLFVAMLKGQQVRVLELDNKGALKSERTLFSKQFGRIRTVRQSPDGALYMTTDNGNNQDVLVKITPER